jgi:HEXXH motif-containing protein
LGDGHIDAEGKLVLGPQVAELMPLDFDSPYSRLLDLTGDAYLVPDPRPPLAGDELEEVLDRLATVRSALAATSPLLLRFVVRFTKVLILQKDSTQPFSSGSNGDYVGRSVIANPQVASTAALADAVVHEAIHSLLYMQEEQQPWVLDQSLYTPTPCVVSPWSGRTLPVRPFVQACFVWYGLANFWAMAASSGGFEPAHAQPFFARAVSGFLKGSLLDRLGAHQPSISVNILECIHEMQARIASSLADDL